MTYEGVQYERQSKMVPLTKLHWYRQALHWKYSRPWRRNSLCQLPWQRGQAKPSGHRQPRTNASQSSCDP